MEKIKINIFGSCCSREIMNYSESYQVCAYVQQNPIHTLKSAPLMIDESEAISALGSNFIKRMIVANFNKTAMDLLFAQESDYLMLDFADCRFGYFQFTNPEGVKIADTWNTTLTLENLKKTRNLEYKFVSRDTITDEEWDSYIDEFLALIKTKYPEERIIINEITFAEKYVENETVKFYNQSGIELSARELIQKIEQKVEAKLPKAKVLKRMHNVFGNVHHIYGNIPLHYANYVYKAMIKQLDFILDVAPPNIYQ